MEAEKQTVALDPKTERYESDSAKTVRLAPHGSPEATEAPVRAELFREDGENAVFSQYAICGKIGDGGMGVVYLARDRRLNRYVAIKRLNAESQANPVLRQRFLHEARAVAALNHANIVHIYALGEDENGPYIVMEYVSGPDNEEVRAEGTTAVGGRVDRPPAKPLTLDRHVARHGQLTSDEAINVLIRLGRAIAYAHTCGVIHRDLKPSNVLLDKSGEPKIVDFGLARLADRLTDKDAHKLTVPGEKLLSLGYSAPEQEQDASVADGRADVYGLGGILYFCLTGQNPRYYREQDIPLALREVLAKALATDREQRWPSVSALTDALMAVQSHTRIETPTVKTTWRCKWCDAVNPISTRYCAECGWEGAESCPECSAEMFIGMQYCGTCGADARAYEGLHTLVTRMSRAMDEHRFERVLSYAGRIHGFEPAGPAGRALMKQIADLRELAEQNILRRNRLLEQIPLEFKAENYERTRAFIQELRALNEDQRVFEDELQRLPDLMIRRDLQRVVRLVKNGDWKAAQRVCEDLVQGNGADDPESQDLLRRINRHFRLRAIGNGLLAAVAVFFLYALLPPAVIRFAGVLGKGGRIAFRPVRGLYQPGAPLDGYARAWLGTAGAADAFSPRKPLAANGATPSAQIPEEMVAKQKLFDQQTAEVEAEQRYFNTGWPIEYRRELDAMLKRRQAVGDYEGWAAAQEERRRFDETRQVSESAGGDPVDLAALKTKYRQMQIDQRLQQSRRRVSVARKYTSELAEIQRRCMQDNAMDRAAAVNAEIKRVRAIPELIEAEALLASSGTPNSEDGVGSLLPIGKEKTALAELAELRTGFEKSLDEVEAAAENQFQTWPGQYEEVLRTLMDQFQQEGDYSGWESVSIEAMRFDADRAIQLRDLVIQPKTLADQQKKFIRLRDDIRLERAQRVVAAFDDYLAKLEALQKKLMLDGKMEAAAAVNAEIRTIRARQDYVEAQAELALVGPPQLEKPAQP